MTGAPPAAAESVSWNVPLIGFSNVASEKFEITVCPFETVIARVTSLAADQFWPSPGCENRRSQAPTAVARNVRVARLENSHAPDATTSTSNPLDATAPNASVVP